MKMKIMYSGIGCNITEEHTVEEFLNIMHREVTNKNWGLELLRNSRETNYQLQFNGRNLPNDFILFTLNDWIEYSGAELVDCLQNDLNTNSE
jgi:hypothetical protein